VTFARISCPAAHARIAGPCRFAGGHPAVGTNTATLQFTLNGSTLSLSVNSTPTLMVTDNTLVVAGGVGLFAQGGNGIVDDFSVAGS
jgi:hypothetical protein